MRWFEAGEGEGGSWGDAVHRDGWGTLRVPELLGGLYRQDDRLMSPDATSFAWDCWDQARCRTTGCCNLPGSTLDNIRVL